MDAYARWIARDEMQIGAALGQRVFQVCVDFMHGASVALLGIGINGRQDRSVGNKSLELSLVDGEAEGVVRVYFFGLDCLEQ